VIDNSSAFRMDPNVPLVIPEINAGRIREHKGIIAVPNCSAITALVPLWPIHRQNRIKRVILSTYQAASGGGAAVMQSWWNRPALISKAAPSSQGDPHPTPNLFSHNTAIDPETGYNDEETKVIKETRKIFEDDQIAIGATASACRCCAPIARRLPSNAKGRSRKLTCAPSWPTHRASRSSMTG
jgi:aspartate-semialdehyde dehydrogenase